jgi:hypothetical protein
LEVDVAPTGRGKGVKYRRGFDIDPGPSAVVEMLGDGTVRGVRGSDVYVEPFRYIMKSALEENVFKVLRI